MHKNNLIAMTLLFGLTPSFAQDRPPIPRLPFTRGKIITTENVKAYRFELNETSELKLDHLKVFSEAYPHPFNRSLTAKVKFSFIPKNISSRKLTNVSILLNNYHNTLITIPEIELYDNNNPVQNQPIEIILEDQRLSSNYKYEYELYLGRFTALPNKADIEEQERREESIRRAKAIEVEKIENERKQLAASEKQRIASEKDRRVQAEQNRIYEIRKQPREFQDLLIKHEICIGMNKRHVQLAFGDPINKSKSSTRSGVKEIWSYYSVIDGFPKRIEVGYFNGIVELVQY